MKKNKAGHTILYHYLDRIERTVRKYEEDLVATGRFKYVRTDSSHKIYVEIATGREVLVLSQCFSPS